MMKTQIVAVLLGVFIGFSLLIPIMSQKNLLNIEYPTSYTPYQRINATSGQIKISGNFSGNVKYLEANFDNQGWENITTGNINSTFTGNYNGTAGQGNLIVRANGNDGFASIIGNISIGDIFIIGGQSNSMGQGREGLGVVDPSDPYIPTMFRYQDNIWAPLADPVGYIHNNKYPGSAWIPFVNNITKIENIPLSIIIVSVDASHINCWTQDGPAQNEVFCYDNMIREVKKATNGIMNVRAMLFFQGESDAEDLTSKSYYYDAASAFVDETLANITFVNPDNHSSKKILIGQIDVCSNYTRINEVRSAQYSLWASNSDVGQGAITYQIPVKPYDNCHFGTKLALDEYGFQWKQAVLDSIYGQLNATQPQLLNATVDAGEPSVLRLIFDTPIIIRNYLNQTTGRVGGLKVGTLNDSNIISSTIKNDSIFVTFNSPIMAGSKLSIGSNRDGNNKSVISNLQGIPAAMQLNYPIMFYGSITK